MTRRSHSYLANCWTPMPLVLDASSQAQGSPENSIPISKRSVKQNHPQPSSNAVLPSPSCHSSTSNPRQFSSAC
jgi:hypothetical protein